MNAAQDHDSAPRGDKLTDEEVVPDRRAYLGGSDMQALSGCSPYACALDVYERKVAQEPEEREPPGEAAHWGVRLEAIVAAEYAEREGVQLEPGHFWRGPLPFLGGTPDRFVVGARRGLEVKTAGLRQAHLWGDADDAIPDHYAIQCAYYMAITGFPRWDVAVLIGGQEFRIYRLNADPELGAALIDLATTFWRNNIEKRIPPAADASDAAAAALARIYRSNRPELLKSNEAIDAMAARLEHAVRACHQAEAEEQAAINDLKAVIGEAAGVEGAWGRITWKKAADSEQLPLKAVRADPAALAAVAKYIKPKPGGRRFVHPWKKSNAAEE